jgi:2-polyprenyl-6-methoxyphenol hydroxylase-like FAD-dependent oxidoreductase
MMDTDVLIVGGGPTGLMLANQLGRRGVRAMIIDRHSGAAQQTRAIGVQARTLEIYAKLGIAKSAFELGAETRGANIWTEGRRKARLPLGDIGNSLSPFPFVFMLGQNDNERIMGDKLRDWSMSVQWNTELVDFEQRGAHVAVTLKQADGTLQQLTGAWVADTEAAGDMVQNELNALPRPESCHAS